MTELENKWEKRLQKHGLGIVQPLTDNSEGETLVTTGSKTDPYAQLRTGIDGGDQFMDGHQIMKIRSLDREIAEWALSNERVQQILLAAFPALHRGAHRKKAGRWARFIYLYFRMGLPQQIVMRDLKLTPEAFKAMRKRIQSLAVRGVPRGQDAPRPTPSVVKGRKGNETK